MALVQKQAPDFECEAVINGDFGRVKLSDFRGKWVVLFFYPFDFTPVCQSEVSDFAGRTEAFKKMGVELIGVSCDSKFTHQQWIKHLKEEQKVTTVPYPLAADFKKMVASQYGVLLEGGMALRGIFIVNPEGRVVWESVYDLPVGRSTDEVLRVLQACQHQAKTGQACLVNWKPQ